MPFTGKVYAMSIVRSRLCHSTVYRGAWQQWGGGGGSSKSFWPLVNTCCINVWWKISLWSQVKGIVTARQNPVCHSNAVLVTNVLKGNISNFTIYHLKSSCCITLLTTLEEMRRLPVHFFFFYMFLFTRYFALPHLLNETEVQRQHLYNTNTTKKSKRSTK